MLSLFFSFFSKIKHKIIISSRRGLSTDNFFYKKKLTSPYYDEKILYHIHHNNKNIPDRMDR